MQKFRRLLFPALALCYILVMGGYYLGRSSVDGPILVTQRSPEAARAAVSESSVPERTRSAAWEPSSVQENGMAAERGRSTASAEAETDGDGRIDLNRATLEELMTLPQIGEVRARRILDYREAHGAFHSAAELMQVDGIGEKIFAGLRDLICVEEQDEDSDH